MSSTLKPTMQGADSSHSSADGVVFGKSAREVLGTTLEPTLPPPRVLRNPRLLGFALLGALALLLLVVMYLLNQFQLKTKQQNAVATILIYSQRLSKAAPQTLLGSETAFAEVDKAAKALTQAKQVLQSDDDTLRWGSFGLQLIPELQNVGTSIERIEVGAKALLEQQDNLTSVTKALHSIQRQSAELLETGNTIAASKWHSNAEPAKVAAVTELTSTAQRLGRTADEVITTSDINLEASMALDRDLAAFKATTLALLNGDPGARMGSTRERVTRTRLDTLLSRCDAMRAVVERVLSGMQGVISARDVQATIVADSELMRPSLEKLQAHLQNQSVLRALPLALLIVATLLTLLLAALCVWRLLLGQAGYTGHASFMRSAATLQRTPPSTPPTSDTPDTEPSMAGVETSQALDAVLRHLHALAQRALQSSAALEQTSIQSQDLIQERSQYVQQLAAIVQGVQHNFSQLHAQSQNQVQELVQGQGQGQGQGQVQLWQQQLQQLLSQMPPQGQAADTPTSDTPTSDAPSADKPTVHAHPALADTPPDAALRTTLLQATMQLQRMADFVQELDEVHQRIAYTMEQAKVVAMQAGIQSSASAATSATGRRSLGVLAQEVQHLAQRCSEASGQAIVLVAALHTDVRDANANIAQVTQHWDDAVGTSSSNLATNPNTSLNTNLNTNLTASLAPEVTQQLSTAIAQALDHLAALVQRLASDCADGANSAASLAQGVLQLQDYGTRELVLNQTLHQQVQTLCEVAQQLTHGLPEHLKRLEPAQDATT